ncbi:UPF0051 protein ycf24 [Hibiscus syriacus]|uniref:UPF0051 protein ycf24 n=1 Tax=Hibiscus syriacus TaxID=106335 RepID=A0A6A3A8L4_HIBSY|nr:UPF0051 protein ycf24 [Hibiscus syriacus]
MSSLLANGISSFSARPTSDSTKSPRGFYPKFDFVKPITSKPPNSRLTKVRADVGFDSQTLTSDPSSSSGLSEETIRLISSLKEEPDWMVEFRLNAYEKFLKMKEPKWSDNHYPPINFQDICYYSAPKKKPTLNSLDVADPELLKYFERLGVPLNERNRLANVAVDAVLDSVSIATTHRKTLEKAGVIFCSISEAIREYPDLVRKYLGRVVPSDDNYYAALNTAFFSDGSFCYIPKDTKCPIPISTYFQINALETGQFERTLIVADEGSFVEYLEGCMAPSYDRNQLHAAVVELYCAEGAEIKYSTVQNWGLVQVQSKAENAKNSSQCDSMLIGDNAAANTYPYIQVKNPSARVEHEASTSKIGEDQLFYFQQRGIEYEKAMSAMVSGFCRDVFYELPDEFGAEVNQLMSLKLEGSVG